jgi:hypothetical protein
MQVMVVMAGGGVEAVEQKMSADASQLGHAVAGKLRGWGRRNGQVGWCLRSFGPSRPCGLLLEFDGEGQY